MTGKIKDPYVAALLNGLVDPNWIELDAMGKEVLEKAKEIAGQSQLSPGLNPLQAITGKIWNNKAEYYFEPKRLTIEGDSVLPNETKPALNTHAFRQEIEQEVEPLFQLYPEQQQNKALNYSLYHIAYASGSRVAFDKPDVSAFDHNRLLAATVACLKEGTDQFLLLKGAISGIQNFIYYDIGGEQIDDAKKASKRLRARSFLVSHLSQAIAEYLVENLKLEQANILFVGGGHFNLLLPNTEITKERLDELSKKLNLGFFENIGIQLSLLIESQEADKDIFTSAGNYYRLVNEKLEHSKQKKHINYLDELFKHAGKQEDKKSQKEDEALGTKVPYSNFILEVQADINILSQVGQEATPAITLLRFIDRDYYLMKNEEEIMNFMTLYGDRIKAAKGLIKVISINNTNFSKKLPIAYGFQFIGKEAPKIKIKKKGEFMEPADDEEEGTRVMTFEDIASMDEKGESGLSFPQLAAMRLDVDDLGTLFGYGLGKDTSFGRMASLSREFQLFFGGFFNTLAKKNKLYITYSGGDDAFVIGSWLNVVHFAEQLNDAFRKFTCQNKNIGFSAGIFLCNPFYPVVRFAKDASDLEKLAKNYGIKTDENKRIDTAIGKDAVCLFNRTLEWPRFKEVMEFARKLSEAVPRQSEENKGSNPQMIRRSMLQHLLKIIQTSVKEQRVYKNEFEFYRNIGRLHGLVSRHGYNKEQLGTRKDLAATIVRELLQESNSPERFADFMVPLQYVLHQTRVINE